MRVSFRHLWYRLLPFLVCLLLILSNSVPFHWLPNFPYSFQWVLLPIFYFAVYYPKLLASWVVFILALIADFLCSCPFGVVCFTYISMYFLSNLLRRYLIELTFFKLWLVFGCILMVVELLQFLFVWLLSKYDVSFMPVIVEFCVLALTYPFFVRFCAHLDRKARENS